jgi:hypothetical protein
MRGPIDWIVEGFLVTLTLIGFLVILIGFLGLITLAIFIDDYLDYEHENLKWPFRFIGFFIGIWLIASIFLMLEDIMPDSFGGGGAGVTSITQPILEQGFDFLLALVEGVINFFVDNPLIFLLLLLLVWVIIEVIDRWFPPEKIKDKFFSREFRMIREMNQEPEERTEPEKQDWDG